MNYTHIVSKLDFKNQTLHSPIIDSFVLIKIEKKKILMLKKFGWAPPLSLKGPVVTVNKNFTLPRSQKIARKKAIFVFLLISLVIVCPPCSHTFLAKETIVRAEACRRNCLR